MLFLISVTVSCEFPEQATELANGQLTNITTVYPFEYDMGDPVIAIATPKPFEEYTQEELMAMPQEEFDALVGTDPTLMTRDMLLVSMQRDALEEIPLEAPAEPVAPEEPTEPA